MDFLDFIIRQLLALLGALTGAILSRSWQPVEHFLQAAGGGGGVLLLLIALLALASLLMLAGVVVFYLRRRHRENAAPQPALRSK